MQSPVPHQPGPHTAPKACGLAVTSLVLGCLGFVLMFIAGIPAIITGHKALGKIRRSGGTIGGSGAATTGLVLGYVTTGLTLLWVAMAALATPAIFKALERANMAENVGKVRELQMVVQFYAMDNKGNYPPDLHVLEHDGYISSPDRLRYKESKTKLLHDWIYFPGHAENDNPDTILIAAPMPTRDGKKRVVGFIDGSVRSIREAEYQQRLREQQAAESSSGP